MRFNDGAMIDYVRAQAGALHYKIIYPGVLPHAQLLPIIEHASAVVLPSRIDNFPNTCLEAMACGKIVIGTRGTSFEQLIDDGISSFVQRCRRCARPASVYRDRFTAARRKKTASSGQSAATHCFAATGKYRRGPFAAVPAGAVPGPKRRSRSFGGGAAKLFLLPARPGQWQIYPCG